MKGLAGAHLDFSLWLEEGRINAKQLERRKHNIRRNLRVQVDAMIYCPYCHKKTIKTVSEQYCCGCLKCIDKLSVAYNEIKEVEKKRKYLAQCHFNGLEPEVIE